ncbi:uncharacterized protein [Temnothorax longispinosus]|uniref:uncharacterized protein isoform X2 n=1 Tax=Temnothorax longispinosus TaxID=300112 RepID=UPI003A9976A6
MFCGLLIFYAFCILKMTSGDPSSLYLNEIRSLSELPMDKLIHIRSSLANNNDVNENENEDIDMYSRRLPLTLPMALPVALKRNSKKPMRRHEEHYDEKAIRRNSTPNGNGNVLIFSNLQSLQKLNRPKRNILIFDAMENNFETDKLYEGMIMLSRSYALYN